jgi:hypothetical protein
VNALEVVRCAIPNADAGLADAILWGRTPFPVGRVSVRQLYSAASRFRRAEDHGVTLCDWCDHKAEVDGCLCRRCHNALRRAVDEGHDAR